MPVYSHCKRFHTPLISSGKACRCRRDGTVRVRMTVSRSTHPHLYHSRNSYLHLYIPTSIDTIDGTGPVFWRPVPVPVWIGQTGPDRPVYRSDLSNGKWPVERQKTGRTAKDRSNGKRPVERQTAGRTVNDRSNGRWSVEQQSTILCMIDKC
jgi:hypothetical protein